MKFHFKIVYKCFVGLILGRLNLKVYTLLCLFSILSSGIAMAQLPAPLAYSYQSANTVCVGASYEGTAPMGVIQNWIVRDCLNNFISSVPSFDCPAVNCGIDTVSVTADYCFDGGVIDQVFCFSITAVDINSVESLPSINSLSFVHYVPSCVDGISYCLDQVSCEGQGYFWYNNSCNSIPYQSCDIYHTNSCLNESDCLFIGAYWRGGVCTQSPLAPIVSVNSILSTPFLLVYSFSDVSINIIAHDMFNCPYNGNGLQYSVNSVVSVATCPSASVCRFFDSLSSYGGASYPPVQYDLSSSFVLDSFSVSSITASSAVLNFFSSFADTYHITDCAGVVVGDTSNNLFSVSGLSADTSYCYKISPHTIQSGCNSYGSESSLNFTTLSAVCDSSHLSLCTNQSFCEGASGTWSNNVCVASVCDSSHLSLCADLAACEGAGFCWYGSGCSSSNVSGVAEVLFSLPLGFSSFFVINGYNSYTFDALFVYSLLDNLKAVHNAYHIDIKSCDGIYAPGNIPRTVYSNVVTSSLLYLTSSSVTNYSTVYNYVADSSLSLFAFSKLFFRYYSDKASVGWYYGPFVSQQVYFTPENVAYLQSFVLSTLEYLKSLDPFFGGDAYRVYNAYSIEVVSYYISVPMQLQIRIFPIYSLYRGFYGAGGASSGKGQKSLGGVKKVIKKGLRQGGGGIYEKTVQ